LCGFTNDEFVADVVRMALMHHHLFTHWHVAKVEEMAHKYCRDHGMDDDGV
jgi:hypothetical protein